MSQESIVSVRLLKPWDLFNAGEIVGVPASAVERMEKIKLAKRCDAEAEGPYPQKLHKPKVRMVRVLALKPFDIFNAGEECAVPEGDGLDNLVEKKVLKVLGFVGEPDAKQEEPPVEKKMESPPMNKAVSSPAKAK